MEYHGERRYVLNCLRKKKKRLDPVEPHPESRNNNPKHTPKSSNLHPRERDEGAEGGGEPCLREKKTNPGKELDA